jgi:hypothetical protein
VFIIFKEMLDCRLLSACYCTMKLGSISSDTTANAAPAPSGHFFPVQDDKFVTPPLATNTISSRLRSSKRVAHEERASSDVEDEEESFSDDDVLSSPELVRNKDDGKVPYRKISVANSSLRMHICRLTEKLTAAKVDLQEANSQHGNATKIIVRLKKEVASANK